MLETFSPCVQTKFRIACDATNTVELELTEAKALISPARSPAGAKGLVQQSFSLIFHGPDNRFFAAGDLSNGFCSPTRLFRPTACSR